MENMVQEIKNLKRIGSLQNYVNSFLFIVANVILNEDYAINLFVDGLRPEIRCMVRIMRPKTIKEAYIQAKQHDRIHAILVKNKKEYRRVTTEEADLQFSEEADLLFCNVEFDHQVFEEMPPRIDIDIQKDSSSSFELDVTREVQDVEDVEISEVFESELNESMVVDSKDRVDTVDAAVIGDEKVDPLSVSRRYVSDKLLPVGRTAESSFTDSLSGLGSTDGSYNKFSTSSEGKLNLHSNPWSNMPSNLSLSLLGGGMKSGVQAGEILYQPRDVRFSAFDEYSVHSNQRGEEPPNGKWLMQPPVSSYIQMPSRSSSVKVNDAKKPKDGNYKIFDEPLAANRNALDSHQGLQSQQFVAFDSDLRNEQPKNLKVVDSSLAGKEQDKEYQNFQPLVRDGQARVQGVSTRSCTKVHKEVVALGRSVDLTKFNNYDELIFELDIFEFNSELKSHIKTWLVVYTDDEGDMSLLESNTSSVISAILLLPLTMRIQKMGPLFIDRIDYSHQFQNENIKMIKARLEDLQNKFGMKPIIVVTEKDYDRDSEAKDISHFGIDSFD